METSGATGKSIWFAGFVCFWRKPHQARESSRQRFFSAYEDLRARVDHELAGNAVDGGKWRLVRISAPGRHFWGFARR